MGLFLLGLLIFLGVHSISIVNEPWRNRMVDTIGEWPWKGIYALAALGGLLLIIYGYGITRYESVILYTPPLWLKHISVVLLLPVFPLLVAAYFPGRIKALTKHPMLLSVKIWSAAHLLATGSLVDVLLFGSFLGWAVWDRMSLKHRQQRSIPGAPASRLNDVIALVAGLGIYLAFVFWFHNQIIGVSPY